MFVGLGLDFTACSPAAQECSPRFLLADLVVKQPIKSGTPRGGFNFFQLGPSCALSLCSSAGAALVFPVPGETFKHSVGSHLHSTVELQVGTPRFLPCLHLCLEVQLQINHFLPCACQLWNVANDTLLPSQIALGFPAITGHCYCRDRIGLPSSKMLLGDLIVLKEGFADWGRVLRGEKINRQDRRSLRSAKIKEQEDRQKGRSTLVNIMSGIIFPMCYSPTRGWSHFLLFETFWEFWVWCSKEGKHPG